MTLVQNWSSPRGQGGQALLPGLGPLTSQQRDLLLCLDSMTLALEGFAKATVRVEVRKKGRTTLSKEISDYLGLGQAQSKEAKEALEREVWLTAGSRRLVYARTLIPLECIDARLLDLLEEKSNEPMGRVLGSRNIPFSKKKLEVGTLKSPGIALDLELDPDTPLIARRYVLFNDKGAEGGGRAPGSGHSMPGKGHSVPGRHSMPGGPDNGAWSIQAAVFEIFSPELLQPASRPSGLLDTTGL